MQQEPSVVRAPLAQMAMPMTLCAASRPRSGSSYWMMAPANAQTMVTTWSGTKLRARQTQRLQAITTTTGTLPTAVVVRPPIAILLSQVQAGRGRSMRCRRSRQLRRRPRLKKNHHPAVACPVRQTTLVAPIPALQIRLGAILDAWSLDALPPIALREKMTSMYALLLIAIAVDELLLQRPPWLAKDAVFLVLPGCSHHMSSQP